MISRNINGLRIKPNKERYLSMKTRFSKMLLVSTIAFAMSLSMTSLTTFANEGENVISINDAETKEINAPGDYTITTNGERVRNGGRVELSNTTDNAVYNITFSGLFMSQISNWTSVLGIKNNASNMVVNFIVEGDNELIGHNHEGIKVSNENDTNSITLNFMTRTGGKLTTSSNYRDSGSTKFNDVGVLNFGSECKMGIKSLAVGDKSYSSIREAWDAGAKAKPFVLELEQNSVGHSFGEWIIDVEPTHTSVGSKHRTCSICGENEVVEIPVIEAIMPPAPEVPVVIPSEPVKADTAIKATSASSNGIVNTGLCFSLIILSGCLIYFPTKKKKI